MAWTVISKPKSKPRILSLLLLCFLIFCFTARTSALALDKRTTAQPTAGNSESDAGIDHSHRNFVTRRDVSSEKIPLLSNREPKEDSSAQDMIEVRSEKARAAEEDGKKRLPREAGGRTTEDENGVGDKSRGDGAGAGHSFRLRARAK